jgi:hypothetical protein
LIVEEARMTTWDELELARAFIGETDRKRLFEKVKSFIEMRDCCKPVYELRSLLTEWLAVPFFERREDWEKWVAEFRPRVESAVGKEEART